MSTSDKPTLDNPTIRTAESSKHKRDCDYCNSPDGVIQATRFVFGRPMTVTLCPKCYYLD